MSERPGVLVVFTRYARSVSWAMKRGWSLGPVLDQIAAREVQAPRNEEGPSASR
ncbi:hypothetical protein AB0I95_14750 [Micromonospora sp. NPDC049751]|uniref:hypothetical protein n=1 Tax=Micromonospora sp. NPDC049751 TaxID=3154837 RepID=UPI0033EF1CCE